MKKKTLEMTLEAVPEHPDPDPALEQYNTPANIAADVLFLAYALSDIRGRRVADLGCGTGIFAVGAKLLGASEVIGVDIDERAVQIAKRSAANIGVEVDFRTCEIKDFNTKCDTVVQNPPFGAQKKHADRPFLERAMAFSDVVYSLHLTKTQEFIELMVRSMGKEITHRNRYSFQIDAMFDFHKREREHIDVTVFRIQKKGGSL